MTDAPKLIATSELQQETAYTKELNTISSFVAKPVMEGDMQNPLQRDIDIIRKLSSHQRNQSDLTSIEVEANANIFKSLEPVERHHSLAPKTALTAEKLREPHVIMIDLGMNKQKDVKQAQFGSP